MVLARSPATQALGEITPYAAFDDGAGICVGTGGNIAGVTTAIASAARRPVLDNG